MAYFSIKPVTENLVIVTQPFRCGKAHGLCSVITGIVMALLSLESLCPYAMTAP